MKRIKYIFLNFVFSLQFIFASNIIPEDSFIRAGSCVSELDGIGCGVFEIIQSNPTSFLDTESANPDNVRPELKMDSANPDNVKSDPKRIQEPEPITPDNVRPELKMNSANPDNVKSDPKRIQEPEPITPDNVRPELKMEFQALDSVDIESKKRKELESQALDNVESGSRRLKKTKVFSLEITNSEFSCKFIDNQNYNTTKKLPYKLITDPTYDQLFKRIFELDNPIDEITGQDRLISLLNSIFYPDAGSDGLKIREVTKFSHEVTEGTQLGPLNLGLTFKCNCYQNGNLNLGYSKIIDIEMQAESQPQFQGRLFEYANKLRSVTNHLPIIILTFSNYQKEEENESFFIRQFRAPLATGTPIELLNDVVEFYFINLFQESSMLKNGIPLRIGRKPINQVGQEWLKLLSTRYWATTYYNKYIVPDIAKDTAVKSALKILSYGY